MSRPSGPPQWTGPRYFQNSNVSASVKIRIRFIGSRDSSGYFLSRYVQSSGSFNAKFVTMFLRETLAAAARVKAGNHSITALGEMGADRRHCDIHDDLRTFFDSLKPYRRFGDFQFKAKLPRPRPLQLTTP